MSWGELPGQLERFADVLRREASTRRTADFIVSQSRRFYTDWARARRVRAQRMPLPLPRGQGLHPVGCELQDCFLSFHYEVATDGTTKKAEFQVQVDGLLDDNGSVIWLQDHWRIDSEAPPEEVKKTHDKDKKSSESREPHPSFHFQRGGHAQDAFVITAGFLPSRGTGLAEGDWRGLMQCPGPRIASLPFDPILAIDFCIAQNDGLLWKRLRNVPEYFSTIEAAQTRLWKPFLEALATREARRRWLGPLAIV